MTPEKNTDFKRGPLTGIKVLDLSSVVSGPMAAVILADQGASVIKVEPPGWGDGIRGLGASRNGLSAIYSMINRNKQSIGVNIKHPKGRDIILSLAESCDVLLQNYRPGKMEKIGLDYEAVSAICPEIVYTSITGVGKVGPLAKQKVYDYVIQALSGALDSNFNTNELSMVRMIIYDKVTALTAAQGITAALLARERGAGGQHVELSMLDTALYFNWADLMWNFSFEGAGVQICGDLVDAAGISETSDGAIVSPYVGAHCSSYASEELIELLSMHEIPAARINRRFEVASNPQVIASESLRSFNHPRGGSMKQAKSPARFSKTPLADPEPSVDLGEHTVEILSELGLSLVEMQDLARQGVLC